MSRLVPLVAVLLLLAPSTTRATEVLCDPAHEDCRTKLLTFIQNERVSIDIAMWFMEDTGMADAIIARFKAGVAVRALVDPRRNSTTPMNATIIAMLRDAGIPIRAKTAGGILHWKFMIFNHQNTLQFSAANYGDYYFKPADPYRDYTDEGIYFGDDPPLVNSFRRKFDDSWIDTTNFSNYANIAAAPARAYPLYTIDPALNFVPWEDFGKRSAPLYTAETERIDVIMYKITEATHADGLIAAVRRGVPVRVITEPDLYRNPSNVWQAYHVDRLHAAGVQVRDRAHAGFNHQKSTLLYSQGLTVFGSSNWTHDSNRVQYEHNYFTDKPYFFTWFRDNFERKWTNRTGNAETKPFTPLSPDPPVYTAPANAATGITTASTVSIGWKPGLWAHRADVYFGTSATPPLHASNVAVSPNTTKTYPLPALVAGKTYYWKVVSKTMAGKVAEGPVWSFTTAGTTTPPPPEEPAAGDVVLYAAESATIRGSWIVEPDTTAAGGRRIRHPNTGLAKIAAPLATPSHYFELTFTAEAGRPYRLWMRGKADGNVYSNDSVYAQFSNSVNASGTAVYRIGTDKGTDYNLEACSGCGLSGWGWEDNGWGTGVLGPPIYFAASGTQTIRIQTREDGLAIDQIVLSPQTYLNASPGATKNDAVILPKSGGSTTPPPPPPPPSATEIVLYASSATITGSAWRVVPDATAAGGARIANVNANAAKVDPAVMNPASYIELTFTAEAGRPYRLWMRGKAEGNLWNNDSVHVQFSGSVTASGAATWRILTASATAYNLESCSGCGLSGWGWEDNGWGTGVLGPAVYFATTGTQRIRIQTREDGLSIDQIVLSASKYLTAPPGAAKNDTTVLAR
jgi:phosphatidylserine/phosphatidylglycerophosphate/cardiolipin synthase-like enzyme